MYHLKTALFLISLKLKYIWPKVKLFVVYLHFLVYTGIYIKTKLINVHISDFCSF